MPPKWGNTATFAYENFPWNTQICFGLSDQRHFNFKFVHINQKFVTLGSSLLIWKVSKWQCNWAGCYGALPRTDNSPSHSFCFNSSLKCLMTVSDVQFLSCFIDAKTPTKWKKLTTWWPNTPCAPPGTEGLTMLTPCNTALLRYCQPGRELCMSRSHALGHQMLCSKPSGSLGFLSTNVLDSL